MAAKVKWRTIPCSCHPSGMVSRYAADNGDFLGPEECPECGGTNRLFVTPTDRLAMYPGGPFRGMEPGAYERGEPYPRGKGE